MISAHKNATDDVYNTTHIHGNDIYSLNVFVLDKNIF